MADDFAARLSSLETSCDQIMNHKAWLSKVLIPTSVHEDGLWQNAAPGNHLAEKAILQAKMIRDLVSSRDDEEELI